MPLCSGQISVGQPRPSVQNVTFSGSLNWSRSDWAMTSMVSAPFASLFFGGSLAFHGSLRPSPSAALSSATITSPVVAANTSDGGSSWYSMLAPLCRFWSSEQAMIFAVTVPTFLA